MARMTRDLLLEYLEEELRVDTSAVHDDTSLFVSGLVDSFSMVALIAFIEKTCETRLKPKDIKLDNLDSVSRMLNFLEQYDDDGVTGG